MTEHRLRQTGSFSSFRGSLREDFKSSPSQFDLRGTSGSGNSPLEKKDSQLQLKESQFKEVESRNEITPLPTTVTRKQLLCTFVAVFSLTLFSVRRKKEDRSIDSELSFTDNIETDRL